MSIKVLIVDDERLERLLIRKSFDWEGEGFEVIGEASSGEEAKALVKQHQPDLIFTDINMPFMDGLAFSAWLQSHCPSARVVIITGYRKFEYAQKAVHLGVKEFLLKPIQKEELQEIVYRCKEDILTEQHQQNKMTELMETNKLQDRLLYEQCLQRLLIGEVDLAVERETLIKYDLMHLLNGGTVLTIKPSQINDKERLVTTLSNVRKTMNFILHQPASGNLILILNEQQTDSFTLFLKELKALCEVEMFLSIGSCGCDLKGVMQSYYESMRVMSYMILTQSHDTMDYKTYLSLQENEMDTELNTTELSFALSNGLLEKVESILSTYAYHLCQKKLLEDDLMNIMALNVTIIYFNVIHQSGKKLSHVFEVEQRFYDQLMNTKSLEEMLDFFIKTAEQIMTVIVDKKEKKGSQLIEDTIAYIEDHLDDSDLSLKRIAAYLFVNESYLSRTFKKEVGETVISYITMKRIQKSIHLLQTTELKVYEIAENVGFEDPHYFGICFKKQTGKTIKQYKEMLYQ